ncbi:MAG: homoserine dehydrogenase, partial [Candidatus Hydrogenedentes bacterium]|nr:homoserine dehydrogenase [Candidatus Hydrogenedentota bacterium]
FVQHARGKVNTMPVGVGVIGAGVVGGGAIRTLLTHRNVIQTRSGVDVALVHVAELDQTRLAEFDLQGVTVSDDAEKLIADPNVQIVCELIGGLEPAKTFILEALNAGKHVVTANKILLAYHAPELSRAAIENNVELRYEAAVAGGIPIIRAVREGLAADHIKALYGILNGTCNYILSRMTEDGLEFEEALRQATELGFAETPPDLDIEGQDTAHKCQILTSLSFSTEVEFDDLYIEGITKITHADVVYAHKLGYAIKLLAIIQDREEGIEARVHPTLVPHTHQLAAVRNEFNAVYVESDVADATLYYGRGAGRFPTASAVIADVAEVARGLGATPAPSFVYAAKRPVLDIGAVISRYYIRLTTLDKPGVLGKVCTILGKSGVSIASFIQQEVRDDKPVPVVLMTHETLESDLRKALEEIDQLDFIRETTHVIRVLQE